MCTVSKFPRLVNLLEFFFILTDVEESLLKCKDGLLKPLLENILSTRQVSAMLKPLDTVFSPSDSFALIFFFFFFFFFVRLSLNSIYIHIPIATAPSRLPFAQ